LEVDAFTFYVRDPCWTGQFLMVSVVGKVTVPEAVYGLRLEPEKYRDKVGKDFKKDQPTIGAAFFENAYRDDYLRRRITPEVEALLEKDRPRYQLFGDFIVREEIKSRAWFLYWDGTKVVAVLTVNYRIPKEFKTRYRSALSKLAHELKGFLIAIDQDLRDELSKSVPHLTSSFLEHTWQVTAEMSLTKDPDSNFRAILEAACATFSISECTGGGAIYLNQLTAWFKLTHESFAALRREKVPEAVLKKLDPLENKQFEVPEDLGREISRVLNKEETEQYQALILNHAQLTQRTLRLKSHYGCIEAAKQLSYEAGTGLIAWVALRRQTLLINDLPKSLLKTIYVESLPDCHSVLAVPMLLRGEELLGVLILECTTPNKFSTSWASVGFLAHAASQAVIVHQIADQSSENRKLAQRTETLLDDAKKDNARFTTLVESLPQCIFQKNLKGEFTYVNQLFCKWMGKSDHELIGNTDADSEIRQAPTYSADDRNVMETGESMSRVEEYETESNELRHIQILKTPLYDRGALFGTQGIFWDITEARRAQRRQAVENAIGSALAEAENRHEAIAGSLGVICKSLECELGFWWRVDRHGQLLCFENSWPESATKFTAFTEWNRKHPLRQGVGFPGRVWERGDVQWNSGESLEPESPRVKLRTQAGLRGTFGLPIRDGSQVLGVMEFFSSATRKPDQGLLEMLGGLGRHIGEDLIRKQAEEERDRLFQLSPDMFCVAGFDGYFKDLNPAWESTLGFTAKELMARPYLDWVHPEDRARTEAVVNELKRTGKSVTVFENRYACKDRPHKWLSWSAVPVLDDEMIYAVARDTTAQVSDHYEVSLHEQAHLMDLVEPELEKIAAISLITSETAVLSEAVRRARTVVQREKAVARTMLDFLRPPGAEMPSAEELTDCRQAVRDCFTDIRSQISETSLKLLIRDTDLPDTPFLANQNGVLSLLYNLVTNAKKALLRRPKVRHGSGGTDKWIVISATTRTESTADSEGRADYIVLSVADTGNGIPTPIIDRLFKGRIINNHDGHGLGTQIIGRVMDYHRGLIRFSTQEGVGTLVELWFPRLVNTSEKPLADQWVRYEKIRELAEPVRVIRETAIRDALSPIYPTDS
jgi:PAS domain S-box-containing protein